MIRRLSTVLLSFAAVVSLAACSSSSDSAAEGTVTAADTVADAAGDAVSEAAGDSEAESEAASGTDAPEAPEANADNVDNGAPAGAAFNDADVVFAQSMIPHHEQAIEMADMALDPNVGAGEALKAIASAIKSAQDAEVTLMTGWLTAWGKPVEMDTSDGHDMSAMEGMMSAQDMEALGELTGPEFDRKWAAMMIEHHKGAITMATTVKADGTNPDVIALADAVISAQEAEITALTPMAEG
jgi:uncharacterized protein (DUF305 family)